MNIKDLVFSSLMGICILYTFILMFKSSKILTLKLKNNITEEDYKSQRKDITKKQLITFILLVILTITYSL